ncbi:hypothetical protein PRIC2_010792 [Phytophthora ramorum]
MRRQSTRRLLSLSSMSRQVSVRHGSFFKPEIPPHLLKLLQKTPEEQQRVAAAKMILVDEPALRNEQSLDLVYSWMLQNCKQYSNNIFGSAPEYIRREICRQMRLIKVKSGGLVIRQGDTGDRCYIVVDGLVDVYVKMEKAVDVVVSPVSPPPMLSTTKQRRMSSEVSAAPVDFGAMVANLGPGAMFGEIVLLNPSARRNATIKASQFTESCDLICLERADYIRLVRTASMEASHYNNAEVLDRMFLFRNWEKHEKMRLVSAMRSRHFTSNDYLYRAGTDAKWMYIVTAGEVMERINWTLEAAGNDAAMRRLLFSQPSSRKNPEKIVNVELTLIGPGDIAGELPFVTSKRSAIFDIKAATDVQALAIDRRYYETVMLTATRDNKPEVYATVKKLRKFSQDREDWRQQRMECGISYPSAHVNICGQRGHLAADASKCDSAPPRQPSIGNNNGSTADKVGWGLVSNKTFGFTLKSVDVEIISNEQCDWLNNATVTSETMLCADTGDGKDSCQGIFSQMPHSAVGPPLTIPTTAPLAMSEPPESHFNQGCSIGHSPKFLLAYHSVSMIIANDTDAPL